MATELRDTLSFQSTSPIPPPPRRRFCLYTKRPFTPQLARTISTEELGRHFTPTAEEIDFAEKSVRGPTARLTLLALLKVFQKLHRFPGPGEIPPMVVQHLRIPLRLGDAVTLESPDQFRRARQHRAIREYTGVMAGSECRSWRWKLAGSGVFGWRRIPRMARVTCCCGRTA